MSVMILTFTSEGLAALVNAMANGTAGVLVTKVGLSDAPFTAAGTLTALPHEFKRLDTFGGDAVDPATIHISIRDDSADAFDLFGFGLYLDDDTLFAVYSQPTRILGKAAISQALISLDVRLAAAVAADIHFGSTAFLDPPATTERSGLVELATSAETLNGSDYQRAVTPGGLKVKAAAITAEAHEYADAKKTEAVAAAANDAAVKKAEAIAAAATDATSKANAAQAAAIAAIDGLIAGAPGALNTLKELADAMGDDPNFAATVTNLIATKKAEAIAAAAVDATAKANAAQAAAQTYADTKKAEAVAAGAADASAKATAAQTAAQTYADTKKAEAISAAATDAQTRAFGAQTTAYNSAVGVAQNMANAAQAAAEANVWQPGDVKYRVTWSVPAGWVECNGQELSRSIDAALFAVIGTAYGAGNGSTTFNVPDFRGEFLRVWDAGRGADPGRGLGTWQDSENRSHTHTFGPSPKIGTGGGYSGVNGVNGNVSVTDPSGGTESRPRNISVLALIKR
jgi:hypothetical protein